MRGFVSAEINRLMTGFTPAIGVVNRLCQTRIGLSHYTSVTLVAESLMATL